jgi:hypothetical protein
MIAHAPLVAVLLVGFVMPLVKLIFDHLMYDGGERLGLLYPRELTSTACSAASTCSGRSSDPVGPAGVFMRILQPWGASTIEQGVCARHGREDGETRGNQCRLPASPVAREATSVGAALMPRIRSTVRRSSRPLLPLRTSLKHAQRRRGIRECSVWIPAPASCIARLPSARRARRYSFAVDEAGGTAC